MTVGRGPVSGQPDDAIADAVAFVARAAKDMNPRWRPAFHVAAPSGWMNDPNGFGWFLGQYHLFYQHHPFSSDWGPIHWGHAVSRDLVSWEDAGIALAPGSPYDSGGCFSGTAVENDGEMTLMYTGHVYDDPDPRTRDVEEFTENQSIATSRDGYSFTKHPGNPVIPDPPPDSSEHFRDPKVWRQGERWCVLLGNGDVAGNGRALFYTSPDLRQWSEPAVIAESDGTLGFMWECPDLFWLDGKDVLLLSPMGLGPLGNGEGPDLRSGYLVGEFDYVDARLSRGDYRDLDLGHDFYAAQSMITPDGRRVVIAWMPARQTGGNEQPDGWAGAMSLPRELRLTEDDRLTMQPVAEVERLRTGDGYSEALVVDGYVDTGIPAEALELVLRAELAGSHADLVGFEVGDHAAGGVRVVLDRSAGELVVDRGGVDSTRRAPLDPGSALELRVFIDRSSVEVFTASGLLTMSSRFYPEAVPSVRLVAEGGSTHFQVQTHTLRDIWTSPPAVAGS